MPATLKSLIRRAFFRYKAFRIIAGYVIVQTRRSGSIDIAHLLAYKEKEANGPVQRDEAIALFGIIKTLRPQTVVEFGFHHGHSAFNFLRALDGDARLYSYDISSVSAARAKELLFDRRFTFIHKSQTQFDPSDVGHRAIDFVFFDASHELSENIESFQRIRSSLLPEAIVAVHDTGLWEKSHFGPTHMDYVSSNTTGLWVTGKQYAHQPQERAFVNWIVSSHPDFGALHLHSVNTLRHGLSLLQRRSVLRNAEST